MKKLLLPFLLLALILPAFAQHGAQQVMIGTARPSSISVVQHSTAVTGAVPTPSITVTPTGSGHLLVVGVWSGAARTVASANDGLGHNFTQATGAAGSANSGNYRGDLWYLLSSSSGATTITVTLSGTATFSEVFFWEVSGSTWAFDLADNVTSGTASGNDYAGVSVTTTAATGFVAAIFLPTAGTVTGNPKSGNEFTSGGDISADDTAGCSLISSSAAAHQPVWTGSASGGGYAACVAAFK